MRPRLGDRSQRLFRVPAREEVEVEPPHAAGERPYVAVGDVDVHLCERVGPARRQGGELLLGGLVCDVERAEEAVGAEREVLDVREHRRSEGHGDEGAEEGERADGGYDGSRVREDVGDAWSRRLSCWSSSEMRRVNNGERKEEAIRELGDRDGFQLLVFGKRSEEFVPR